MWQNFWIYFVLFILPGEATSKAIKAFSLGSHVCSGAVEWHLLNRIFKERKKERGRTTYSTKEVSESFLFSLSRRGRDWNIS